ncbi:MAG: hypothetical protein BWY92_01720 [Firmicutes bacterium ADurb.BinA052]|nr:MAG: hypothetical protein BWY92_01720 [Firmicutes bacterium ADurb.BinA052]
MGRNGTRNNAAGTLNMFPKFELVPIMMYLSVLAKVFLPSTIPVSRTSRPSSRRITSAASRATSTALLTDTPTSAVLSDGASLIPSPIYPTTCPDFFRAAITLSFWSGLSRAQTVACSARWASSSSSMESTSCPMSTPFTLSPTRSHIRAVTSSLSPVSILISTPSASACSRASRVLSFGGSMNDTYPTNVMFDSSEIE